MKKTYIGILFSLAAISAGAQTVQDGLTFSENTYFGTARSIGMGNAMTAVGGDLGSIGINPAGSAVAGYSQFTISPGLTISSSSSSYSAYPVNGTDVFSNANKQNKSVITLPNIGMNLNFKTGRKSGLKAVTFGFVFNGTNNFNEKMRAGGLNDKTSYLGSMAVLAEGFDVDFLNGYLDASGKDIDDIDHPYFYGDDRGMYAPWNVIANAQAGAIGTFGDVEDPAYYYRYIGATEMFTPTDEFDADGNRIYDIGIGGPLRQTYGRTNSGSKYDGLLNVGFNFSDRFYLGANFGVTSVDYSSSEYFKEFSRDPNDFPIVLLNDKGEEYTIHFDNYRNQYVYDMSASGVYAKIGFIARPVDGLRVGAAIQTPTLLNVKETWQHAVDINYIGASSGSATSPRGSYEYFLRSPYRANAGVAYTFGKLALVSVDYEMTDYSTMKFKEVDNWNDSFDGLNDEIRNTMGVSHQVRIGAEFKATPEIAIRAGYNYTTTPTYSYDGNSKITLNDKINAATIGLGYSSPGSFFADFAARMRAYANEYIFPYADYINDVASPIIKNERTRWDVVLTLGWRF